MTNSSSSNGSEGLKNLGAQRLRWRTLRYAGPLQRKRCAPPSLIDTRPRAPALITPCLGRRLVLLSRPSAMHNPIRFKLFLMMVLEFFIWGCWLPLIYGYLPSLDFSPGQQSWILNAFPIAAIVGMFFSTQYADRHFSAEKFMAFSHLVGGVAILGLA